MPVPPWVAGRADLVVASGAQLAQDLARRAGPAGGLEDRAHHTVGVRHPHALPAHVADHRADAGVLQQRRQHVRLPRICGGKMLVEEVASTVELTTVQRNDKV